MRVSVGFVVLFQCSCWVAFLTGESTAAAEWGEKGREPLNVVLEPDVPMVNLEIPSYDGKMDVYFKNVKPGTQYDVKVSYPGTTPTQFIFLRPKEYVSSRRLRRLLDTEKYGFRSDSNGNDEGEDMVILLTRRKGIAHDPLVESRPVRFNIVLETLHFGIPADAFKLIALVVFGIIFALRVLKPTIHSLLSESFRHDESYNRSR